MRRSIPSIITTVTFAALAITACTLSIVYADVWAKGLVAYLAGTSLMLSLISGFTISFDGARDDLVAYELEVNNSIKRAAVKAVAVLVGLAAFGLSMFATTNAGVMETLITTSAAALSIVVGMAAGFMAGYQLEAQHQPAGRRG